MPVNFSELSSEYLGILYEGLLDYELRTAPADDPIVFLAVGDEPALPLSCLEAMETKQIKELFEKMKEKRKGVGEEEGDEEESAEEEEQTEADGEGEAEPAEADEELEEGEAVSEGEAARVRASTTGSWRRTPRNHGASANCMPETSLARKASGNSWRKPRTRAAARKRHLGLKRNLKRR